MQAFHRKWNCVFLWSIVQVYQCCMHIRSTRYKTSWSNIIVLWMSHCTKTEVTNTKVVCFFFWLIFNDIKYRHVSCLYYLQFCFSRKTFYSSVNFICALCGRFSFYLVGFLCVLVFVESRHRTAVYGHARDVRVWIRNNGNIELGKSQQHRANRKCHMQM